MPDVITTILRKIHTDSGNKSGENEQDIKELCIPNSLSTGERSEISLHSFLLIYYPPNHMYLINQCLNYIEWEPSLEGNGPELENPHEIQ